MRGLAFALLLLLGGNALAQPVTGLGPTSLTTAWVTSDQSYISNITLADVPGLSINLQAGHTYSFRVELLYTDASAGNNGGIQVAMAGTVNPSNIIYSGWQFENNSIEGQAQATALGGVVASSAGPATIGHLQVIGSITVVTAGTLTVQAAQYSANVTPTVIKQGSIFVATDMP